MTIKEAILKSLDEIGEVANYNDVYQHIIKNEYYVFAGATPSATVSAQLGSFIRNGDTRVKRLKQPGGSYSYYLAKNEHDIDIDVLVGSMNIDSKKVSKLKGYKERDLHLLLSSYLKNTDVYSKTIFHEQSTTKDSHQKWVHPDMVGIKFNTLKSAVSHNFLKAINREDTIKMFSYEVKKEITSDYDLKKYYFQAVSNSSWANQGFLAAFEISDSLIDEMERLSQSFGIGIIELKANPYESKIIFPASNNNLDFKTIDKLCKINKDFERFVEQTEKLITANERYVKATERELNDICDKFFTNDSEIEKYCKEKNIPYEVDDVQ